MRHVHALTWALCGAMGVGFSCVYLAGIVNLGLSGLMRGLLNITPTVLLTGACIGIAGSVLQRSGCLTGITAGATTLLAIIASQFVDILITGSEPGHPWYTDAIGIPIGIVCGGVFLWIEKGVGTYLRRMRREG